MGEELFSCCLCVGREQEGLLRVQEPPVGVPTVALDLSRGWRAHELCARIVPETWVDEVDEGLGFREKVVFGVDAIEKARWQLVSGNQSIMVGERTKLTVAYRNARHA